MQWLERMAEALDFIEDHLTEAIPMEVVARQAYCWSFHFQRTFHMITGCTVAEYIRQRRLTRAAHDLTSTSLSVLEIAQKYRYESPESFTKAFRRVHGITPTDARRVGAPLTACSRMVFHLSLKGDQEMEYRIEERHAFTVTGKMIRTTERDGENLRVIPGFWVQSYQDGTVAALRAATPDGTLMGICMDQDPDAEEFSYVIGGEGSLPIPGDGMRHWTIPASTWAVFVSLGSLPDAVQAVERRIFENGSPPPDISTRGTGNRGAATGRRSRRGLPVRGLGSRGQGRPRPILRTPSTPVVREITR